MNRTRSEVAAWLNVCRRHQNDVTTAQLMRSVASGRYGSLSEAIAEWMRAGCDDPRVFAGVTADDVDAHLTRQWEALQRQYGVYSEKSHAWSESARGEYMARMIAEQEWLLAMRDEFGAPLDADEVARLEDELTNARKSA